MHVRRTGAVALAVVAAGAFVLAAVVLSGASYDWRFGPVRVRVSDFVRPLVLSGVFGALASWAGWPWKAARVLAPAVLGVWVLLAAGGYARTAAPEFVPVSDIAVIESYTIHATRGQLFVGPYSRFQWHHPGPLLFYVLAPFYVMSGHRSAGLAAGALAINLCSLLAILIIAARAGRTTLALSIGGLTVAFMWRASDFVVSEWNPHVLVLPTMALVLLCAETIATRMWRLPLVALVASLVVQTHVGLVPTVFALTGACVSALGFSAMREEDRRRKLRAAFNVAAWVLAAAWLMPLAEELYASPGNLSELWRFFAVGERTGQTSAVAVRAWSDMLSALFRPDFRVAWGGEYDASDAAWIPVVAWTQVAMLALVFGRAARSRRQFEAALSGLLLLASLVALWSVTRIEDDLYDHAVFWIAGIGVLNLAVLVDAALASRLGGRIDRLKPLLVSVLFAGGAVVGIQELVDQVRRSFEPNLEQLAARRLADAVEEELRSAPGCKPLVRIDHPAWPIAAGILLQLQRDEVPFAVEDGWLPMFSDAVAARGDETCVLSIAWPEERARLESDSGHEVIAERDRITIFLARPSPR